MAAYRHIYINYWQDGFVLDLTPEEKYFYIYLMSNSKTSQCGIYELPKRIIETEMGYNKETVEKLIKRFEEYGKIKYCEGTKEIILKNWMRHNRANSPMVKKCIAKELENIKSREFVDLFYKVSKECGYNVKDFLVEKIDNKEGVENKGENKNGKYKPKYTKSKHAKQHKDEDEELYRKPTKEELEAVRREFESLRKK